MKVIDAIHETIREMREAADGKEDVFCATVYADTCFEENAIVMFMEIGDYPHMHAAMQDLHDRLSAKLGYSVSVCHNHPTDEQVLIHGSAFDSRPYDSTECCKEDTIRCCLDYLETREGYRPEIRMLAEYAEAYFERCDAYDSVQILLERLDWNKDPLLQLISIDLFGKKLD